MNSIKNPHETLTEWKNALPNHFEFNEIRILINHYNYKKKELIRVLFMERRFLKFKDTSH